MFVRGNLTEEHVYNLNAFSDVFTDDYEEDDGVGPRYGIYGTVDGENIALAKYRNAETRDEQFEFLFDTVQDEGLFFEFADDEDEEDEEEPEPKPKHKVVVFTNTKEEALDIAEILRIILSNKKSTSTK